MNAAHTSCRHPWTVRHHCARRSGTAISTTPPARKSTPPINRLAAAYGSAGTVAAASTRTLTGRDPLAFIATTVQSPLWTGQVST